ncbi:MAG: ATP-binding cassette domain-containing protein [Candidatus Bathyarchaeota archaeon]|nr:ATP-binding cassette domain-containing protein [Candidatus Bathyarchaeota archaeon]
MVIQVRGASENNLRFVDVDFLDGLTAVTGVSGSGKTSLVFDTLYHESRRRFLDIFSHSSSEMRLVPARVHSISGLGPAVAVGQNLLNRNPNSTLATASGLHPYLRLLYARFGKRFCQVCGTPLSVLTEDRIVNMLLSAANLTKDKIGVIAPLMSRAKGSHQTLLRLLEKQFGSEVLLVDGKKWTRQKLIPNLEHRVEVKIAELKAGTSTRDIRNVVQLAAALGANAIVMQYDHNRETLSRVASCVECGAWFSELEPSHFHTPCSLCGGEGCTQCGLTGLQPEAASVRWANMRLTELLALTVEEAKSLFEDPDLPPIPNRLKTEISRRLDSLATLGLGYIQLDRPSPTLSRGESQRVRLAVSLTSHLEDVLHVLDEPTIGQHPADVARLLTAFSKLRGPVVFVEHDRTATSAADQTVDIGPGAGKNGGRIVFTGTPDGLLKAATTTGLYFGLREKVSIPCKRPKPERFIKIQGADKHNLQKINVSFPLNCLTAITGVSGSGKSTLVEEVLIPSLNKRKPVGCSRAEGTKIKAVIVDQSPIGKNPRSNPATYTKLSNIVRDVFAKATKYTPSHFSFNRSEGACPRCKGIGAVEVRMRYLPSTWIKCSDCDGQRFSEEILRAKVAFGKHKFSIADFYRLSISQVKRLFAGEKRLSASSRATAELILEALETIGLGYLSLGQPSPTLSGGEAQRIKLAKYLGRRSLIERLIILDEPSTGLHPKDLSGLLEVLNSLIRAGATIVVVEHNTDVIRAADWIIDLGPEAGPKGGRVIFEGPPEKLIHKAESFTGRALREEALAKPTWRQSSKKKRGSQYVSIRNARANNLKRVDVDFPKRALTVVTGVSGSGKSSLVHNVIESEARRRFLEILSMYERQGTREGPEAEVDSVTGLGVSLSITPGRRLYRLRSTVGSATEIQHHLAALLATIGERRCPECGLKMHKGEEWTCIRCHKTAPIAKPRHFSPSTYSAACPKCHGVGTVQTPAPEKLIVDPEKPLCNGAMYSPGFFPKGYLCKPYNGGYYEVQALAERHNFDPATTPWNEMTSTAQSAFLFGDQKHLKVTYESHKRKLTTRKILFTGFFQRWLRDWDVGGTYTHTQKCSRCEGTGFRPEYLAVTLVGYNVHQLNEMPLSKLAKITNQLSIPSSQARHTGNSLSKIRKRLNFLIQVGLGYLHLNRVSGTLSAGEAQRTRLASLLGSGLTSLTILLDEPTRGMHPSEVEALLDALKELRKEGNTVIIVEHDPMVIRAADYLIDMGPGAGAAGGSIVAAGKPEEVRTSETLTAEWLRGERRMRSQKDIVGHTLLTNRQPKDWLVIKGARGNNLKGEQIQIPLGLLVGFCGVSGSGKSTLLIDTLGRAMAPKKITTSVAYEPMEPQEFGSIEKAPARTILLDQARKGIRSPADFLGLFKPLLRIYGESEDARTLGLDEKDLKKPCSTCEGRGSTRTDLGFLPAIFNSCEACRGTGRKPEAWEISVKGVAFPELNSLTIDEIYDLFGEEKGLIRKLKAAREVGLGYLVMRQPGYTMSGGEAQRLRIAREISNKHAGGTLYILDEPTVGQHLEDVNRLIGVLHRLVDRGNSVVVIEHHPHLLAACDWLIELGPVGGPEGGRVVASGKPETVALKDTPTAPYLKAAIEGKL